MLAKKIEENVSDRRRSFRNVASESFIDSEEIAVELMELPTAFGMGKRLFDVVFSSFVLILLLPIFVAVALVVKCTSKGPIFFPQTRVGAGGRHFKMWKFRTMVVNAEAMKAQLESQNEVSGPVFKIKHDPRITAAGRFLRRYSIDELPQFWNVLAGDMSVVGPRPPLPKEVMKYRNWQLRRLCVKPGLTCIWQVSGRSTIDFDTWMRMDIRYIEGASLDLDLRLVVRTVRVVLDADGAF